MSREAATILLLIMVFAVLLILSLRLSMFMAGRAICKVITIFRDRDAVRPELARTPRELGLVYRPFRSLVRDYKPWALQTLVQAGVVKPGIPPDALYLSEEKLDETGGIQCR